MQAQWQRPWEPRPSLFSCLISRMEEGAGLSTDQRFLCKPAGLQLAVPSSGPSLGDTEGLVRVGCPIQFCPHHP